MRLLRAGGIVLAAAVVLLAATAVYATRWVYPPVGPPYVRVHRYTSRTEQLTRSGWVPVSDSAYADSLRRDPFYDLRETPRGH